MTDAKMLVSIRVHKPEVVQRFWRKIQADSTQRGRSRCNSCGCSLAISRAANQHISQTMKLNDCQLQQNRFCHNFHKAEINLGTRGMSGGIARDDDRRVVAVSDTRSNASARQMHGSCCNFTAQPALAEISASPEVERLFRPKRVLVLTKETRYQLEKRMQSEQSEAEFEAFLNARGSDYQHLLSKHNKHLAFLERIVSELQKRNIQTEIKKSWEYSLEHSCWADAIVTAGGDGTFLLAANKVPDCSKPVIGFNTDPCSSEGYLCINTDHLKSNRTMPSPLSVEQIFHRLFNAEFKWLARQRIRVSITSESNKDLVPEKLQALKKPWITAESRWSDSDTEIRRLRKLECVVPQAKHEEQTKQQHFLATNEVFVGESLSSRVSQYRLQIDSGPSVKQKSCGITVCTGTGSSSWYSNINRISSETVSELLNLAHQANNIDLPVTDRSFIDKICNGYNNNLLFHPSEKSNDPGMAFAVRDPIVNSMLPPSLQRGFCKTIKIKSHGYDSYLVIDGGLCFPFNDGATATLEIQPFDALKTIML